MTVPEWRVIRVAVALALIFLAGVVTGRWTAPRAVTSMQFRPLPPPAQAQGNPDIAINHLLAYVDLSPEQIGAIRPILTKWASEIQGAVPMSEERKDAFLKYSAQIRRELKPEQYPAYDAMVESMKIQAIRKQKRRSGP